MRQGARGIDLATIRIRPRAVRRRGPAVSLIALALGTALAIVFWFAGRQGGKGTEYAIAGGLIGVAIAVIVPLVRGVTPVVKTDVFDWSNDDLQKAIQQRQLANNFLNAASMKIGQAYMDAIARFLGEDKPMRFVEAVKPGFFKRLFSR